MGVVVELQRDTPTFARATIAWADVQHKLGYDAMPDCRAAAVEVRDGMRDAPVVLLLLLRYVRDAPRSASLLAAAGLERCPCDYDMITTWLPCDYYMITAGLRVRPAAARTSSRQGSRFERRARACSLLERLDEAECAGYYVITT